MTATANDTRTVLSLSLDQIDGICMRLNQAIGIVDLLGNVNDSGMDDDSMNNASWAAKSLLKEVMGMIDSPWTETKIASVEGGTA